MQVKSIAECSKGSILQYFRSALSNHMALRPLLCLFLSGCLRQVSLYYRVSFLIILVVNLSLCILDNFSFFCRHLLTFFSKLTFLKMSFWNTISVKGFGSRSGPTVYIGYQYTTKATASKERFKSTLCGFNNQRPYSKRARI